MIEYVGKVLSGGGERATGRICRVKEGKGEEIRAARILLLETTEDMRILANTDAVGAVLIGDKETEAPDTENCGIPVLFVCGADGRILSDISNKIAILDCIGSRLYIDPDIDVINRYFGSIAALPRKRIPWLCTDGGVYPPRCDGLAVSVSGDEESVYDGLGDITDRHAGARIVVKMTWGDGALGCVRGVFRAAVWGRISLAYGANTPQNAERCMELTHTAYCTLEKEGREFNGFIPKGIWIDTPILLLSPPTRYADFFVIDCEELILRFAGTEEDEATVLRVMEHAAEFARGTKEGKICLFARGKHASLCVEYLCSRDVVREIYTDTRGASEMEGWL